MKTLIVLFLLLIMAPLCFAQTECTLTTQESPTLRGLKLGMTEQEFSKVYSMVIITKSPGESGEVGETKVIISNKYSPVVLKGVDFITAYFFENKLYSFNIIYSNEPRWKDFNDFVGNGLSTLRLPKLWKRTSDMTGNLNCSEFKIGVFVNNEEDGRVLLYLDNLKIKEEIKKLVESRFKP